MKHAKSEANDNFHSVKDLALKFNVSERSVRRWIDDGELRKHQFGRSVRISGDDLEAFIRARRG